jgi:hypothetical protein
MSMETLQKRLEQSNLDKGLEVLMKQHQSIKKVFEKLNGDGNFFYFLTGIFL